MNALIVPFGKYKDKCVTDLLADEKYVNWLKNQAGIKDKYPVIYNIVVHQTFNTTNNSKTPEHNKLQNLFLDKNNKQKLISKIYERKRTETLIRIEHDNKIIEMINNKVLNNKQIKESFGEISIPYLDFIEKIKCSVTMFEYIYNWDLYLSFCLKKTHPIYFTSNKLERIVKERKKIKEQYDIEENKKYQNNLLLPNKLIEEFQKITQKIAVNEPFKKNEKICKLIRKFKESNIYNKDDDNYVKGPSYKRNLEVSLGILSDTMSTYEEEKIDIQQTIKDTILNINDMKRNYEISYKENYNSNFNKYYNHYIKNYYYDILIEKNKNLTKRERKICRECIVVYFEHDEIKIRFKVYNGLDYYDRDDNYLFCELKPTLSDDYPCVLRKMATQIKLTRGKICFTCAHFVLLVGNFTSNVTSKEQLIKIFSQHNIEVIFTNELFEASDLDLEINSVNKNIEQLLLQTQQQLLQKEKENINLKKKIKYLEEEIINLKKK